ncbi:MAG: phenylalanine--tRNA ligase subunit alpha [Clostridiales bacterium]|nr:phenylalanine--tRNA ligase subunit alpha [Clostridiales bacterium]
MQDKINEILKSSEDQLQEIEDAKQLQELRVQFLGKKGRFTEVLRSMGNVAPEERPLIGKLVNEAREKIQKAIEFHENRLSQIEKEIRLKIERVDVSVPGKKPEVGAVHPLSVTTQQLEDIFIAMGYSIAEGPEVELDEYNFELLNVPKDHTSRDAQDSFYINENVLLRPHTSPVQARTMLSQKPPIKIVCPGRVYRVDEVDATHSPVFHQLEGLVIDKGIHMGHLKGTLDEFVKKLYGENARTKLRPSFFPFTEPSAEVDVSCYVCDGKDDNCKVCKGTGWVEIMGCGMVNPKVLDGCGIDSTVYSGFAFGMGLDRITVSKYNISDLRTLFENDLRFLSQFLGG